MTRRQPARPLTAINHDGDDLAWLASAKGRTNDDGGRADDIVSDESVASKDGFRRRFLAAVCLLDALFEAPRPIGVTAHAAVRFGERFRGFSRQSLLGAALPSAPRWSDFAALVLLADEEPLLLPAWLRALEELLAPYHDWPDGTFAAPSGPARLVVRNRRLVTLWPRAGVTAPALAS